MGNIEPLLGKEKPVMGNIEPLLGITKPAEGLNKPCQGNVNGRKYFAAEGFNVKISLSLPFISQTYTKAVAISVRQTRTRNFVKCHPRVVFTESFHAMVNTDEVCLPCERKFDRQSKVQVKRHRDREPSRLSIKKIISSMKKRKARRKLKRIYRKSTPKSSSLYKLATDYKLWYVTYAHRCDCFFTNFANLKRWAANKLLQNSKQASMHSLAEHKTVKSCSCTKRNCASKMKLLMSGDIELNPGPEQNVCDQTALSVGSTVLLNYRLRQLGLRPHDVGGAGDCFFRAVSHQLYGDSSHHLHVREVGVQYLRDNPESFIESNTEHSWNDYLSNMSMQGTWCDALIVQAVAESQHVNIYIIESHENFAEVTLVEPNHLSQGPPATLYLGHVNEEHYVSTVPYSSDIENQHSNNHLKLIEQNVLSEQPHVNMSRKRKCGVRKFRLTAKTSQNESKTPEQKQKWNAYMKLYKKKRYGKKNPGFECENEIQSSGTVENLTTGCQSETCEQSTTKETKKGNRKNMDEVIKRFHNMVSQGPLYICSCCDQLWYKHSVSTADKIRKSNPTAANYLHNIKSINNKEWLCRTCQKYLVKNKVPPVALVNGMQFPVKPDFFDLNELEYRLLAPRLAFQKLMQAPRGRQFKIHGNVVNVPAEVSNTVNMLPRLPSETGTIKVNLKRKLQYKSSALSLNVRPHKVVQAANWLIRNSSLYRQEGITLNQDWGVQCSASCLFDENNNEFENQQSQDSDNSSCNIQTDISSNEVVDSEDQWSEDEAELTLELLTPC